jgi:hypothetical protein
MVFEVFMTVRIMMLLFWIWRHVHSSVYANVWENILSASSGLKWMLRSGGIYVGLKEGIAEGFV